MIKASSKEFELLKIDLNEIKKQINIYFGFIVGTNGLFISIAFILYDKGESHFNIYFVIAIALVNLMLLYNIIRYKFSSHNKIAGYLRLLSLECNYEQAKTSNTHITIDDNSNELYCWEYIMFRNDSITIEKEFPEKKILNLDFDFEPKNREQCVRYELDYAKTKRNFLKKLIFNNKSNYRFLKDFYKLNKVVTFFFFNSKYHKYKLTSWKFIRNIFNSFLIIYSILIFGSVLILVKSNLESGFDYLFMFFIVASFPFLYYFFFNERQLLRHDKSSDFFFWSFLPFRVEYLNKYGITPTYTSTHFYRYVKNIYYLKLIHKNKDEKFIKKSAKKINLDELENKLRRGEKFKKKELKFIRKLKKEYKNA